MDDATSGRNHDVILHLPVTKIHEISAAHESTDCFIGDVVRYIGVLIYHLNCFAFLYCWIPSGTFFYSDDGLVKDFLWTRLDVTLEHKDLAMVMVSMDTL